MVHFKRLNRLHTSVLAYLSATTAYYMGKDGQSRAASQWKGKGAEAFGLTGEVDFMMAERVADGFHPTEPGVKLRQNAGEKAKFVPMLDDEGKPMLSKKGKPIGDWKGGFLGIDMKFDMPKSVSLLAAWAEPEERQRILDAFQASVDTAIAFAEKVAETRKGKSGKNLRYTDVQGLFCATFLHAASRELEPHWHIHAFAMNVAIGDDGKTRALETGEMFRHKPAIGAVQQADFVKRMMGLGYPIEKVRQVDRNGRETGVVSFDIAGFPREVIDMFSTRHHQIKKAKEELGLSDAQAWKVTRKGKDEPPFHELMAHFADLHKKTIERFPQLARVTDLKHGKSVLDQEPEKDLADPQFDPVMSRLHRHAKQSIVTRCDIMTRIAMEGVGRLGAEDIYKATDAFLERDDMAKVQPIKDRNHSPSTLRTTRRFSEIRYAAADVVEQERQIIRLIRDRREEIDVQSLDPELVNRTVERFEKANGYSLSGEQGKVVKHVTQETGGVAIIEGFAGTGKTSTSEVWIGCFHEDGRRVLGVAIGNAAAEKLEAESHIPCISVAKLLARIEHGIEKLTDRDVLVVDEAGMVGTRNMTRLLELAYEAKAKIVMAGDTQQLQPVDYGGALRLGINEVGENVQMTEMRRQKATPADPTNQNRKIAEKLYEHQAVRPHERSSLEGKEYGGQIVTMMRRNGKLEVFEDRTEALSELTMHWLADETPVHEKIVLTHTNADGRAANMAIREGLREREVLKGEDCYAPILTDTGPEGIELAVADRIRFNDADRKVGVINGTIATIRSIEQLPEGRLRVSAVVESESKLRNGKEVIFETGDEGFQHFQHAYSVTVHGAQGLSKKHVYHLVNGEMIDQHLGLVAYTRNVEGYKAYAGYDDLEAMKQRVGMDGLKENVLEAGILQEAPVTLRRQQAQAALVKAPTPVRNLHPDHAKVEDQVSRMLAEIAQRDLEPKRKRGRERGEIRER